MSVKTEADEKREVALENISRAIKALSEIVIDRVSGSGDYNDGYRVELKKSLNELIDIRERLHG